jgi:SAM-dependent methyltransferase
MDESTLTASEAIKALQVMQGNHGFADPVTWLRYRDIKTFKAVHATAVERCPDCDGIASAPLGQYVYYSTLCHLRECMDCGLIWSDANIDSDVVSSHFEMAYKDEGYFEQARAPIFEQLANQIDAATPPGGSVLDVGGGMGHLMALLRKRRPDIQATVLDISYVSIEYARKQFALQGICGELSSLPADALYDTVVCSDVLYYTSNLAQCWQALARISRRTLIVRGPDKLPVIRAGQWLRSIFPSPLQDRVFGFNPEHRFVFGRDYLRCRLEAIGFDSRIVPANILRPRSTLKRIATALLTVVSRITRRAPSMVLVATRRDRR